MILSDYDIENAIRAKRLVVKPFKDDSIRENGLDLRLDDEIAYRNPEFNPEIFDPTNEEHVKNEYMIRKGGEKLLLPGKTQVLLSTQESLKLPFDMMGFVELRSTWARHGLSVPPTIIDAGFSGTITLEVINNVPYVMALKPGMKFVRIIFASTVSPVTKAYKGAYLNQKGIWLPKVLK